MKVKTFPLLLFGVNCYVVYDPEGKEAVIVDPGIVDNREIDTIDEFLAENQLKVVGIINTHLHIDHALANTGLARKYDADVLAHPDDAFLGTRMLEQAQQFGLPFKIESAGVSKDLKDGDKIKVGNGELEVIHTPGHSPGGIVLYDKADGFIISGDSLFEGSIGRTDLPGGDMAKLLYSIKKRLYTLPDDTVVYPGHGGPTTIGREKQSNPFVRG
ncbi:MAG: MBL fold metallo-hydrolase [Muribaculaceae bacterium]|nr:MBL fold metallo-hydrolase [Muribaculaceae bacterium]